MLHEMFQDPDEPDLHSLPLKYRLFHLSIHEAAGLVAVDMWISGEFSDNYFDLLPNQTQIIYFKPAQLLPLESIPLTTKFIYNKESKK